MVETEEKAAAISGNETAEPSKIPSGEVPPPVYQSEGSTVFAVRFAANAVPALLGMIKLHHRLEHIPEATPSAYLKYLVVQDAERTRDEIKKRRNKVTG